MGCGNSKIPKIPFQERTESLIKEGELSSGRSFDNGNKKEDNLNNKNMKNLTKKNNDKLEDSIIIRGKEKKINSQLKFFNNENENINNVFLDLKNDNNFNENNKYNNENYDINKKINNEKENSIIINDIINDNYNKNDIKNNNNDKFFKNYMNEEININSDYKDNNKSIKNIKPYKSNNNNINYDNNNIIKNDNSNNIINYDNNNNINNDYNNNNENYFNNNDNFNNINNIINSDILEKNIPENFIKTIKHPKVYDSNFINYQTITSHSLEITCIINLKSVEKIASSSLDSKIMIYTYNSEKKFFFEFKTLKAHKGGVYNLKEFIDLNLLSSCSVDRTIKLWDLFSFELKYTLIGHSNNVLTSDYYIKNNNENYIISGGDDCNIIIWNIKNNSSYEIINTITSHKNSVICVLYIDYLKLLFSGGNDKYLIVYDSYKNFEIIKKENINSEINCIKYINNRLLVSCEDGNIHFFSLKNLTKLTTVAFCNSSVNDFDILFFDSIKCFLFIANGDGKGRIWEVGTEKIEILNGHILPLTGIIYFNNDIIVTCSMDKTIKVWEKVVHNKFKNNLQ